VAVVVRLGAMLVVVAALAGCCVIAEDPQGVRATWTEAALWHYASNYTAVPGKPVETSMSMCFHHSNTTPPEPEPCFEVFGNAKGTRPMEEAVTVFSDGEVTYDGGRLGSRQDTVSSVQARIQDILAAIGFDPTFEDFDLYPTVMCRSDL
jgi:hypothetical protein